MITASEARLTREKAMIDYCTKHIEPLIKASSGHKSIHFGTFTSWGAPRKLMLNNYCNTHPWLSWEDEDTPTAEEIISYLNSLGFMAKLVERHYNYKAAYSSSRRTKYYDAGSVKYYTLEISF